MEVRTRFGWTCVVLAAMVIGAVATAAAAGTPKYDGKYEVLNEPSLHQPGKVKAVEFADFYCPHCHMFEQVAVPFLEKEFGDKVEVVMVGFPVIAGKLPTAFEMYEQAQVMGKGPEMKKVLFRTIHQERIHILDKVIRESLIKEVGLDPAAFEAGMDSGKPTQALEEGKKWGQRVKVESTPTIVLDGNIKVAGVNLTPENLKAVIASILTVDAKTEGAPKGKKGKK